MWQKICYQFDEMIKCDELTDSRQTNAAQKNRHEVEIVM